MARKKKVSGSGRTGSGLSRRRGQKFVDRIYGPQGLPWGTKLDRVGRRGYRGKTGALGKNAGPGAGTPGASCRTAAGAISEMFRVPGAGRRRSRTPNRATCRRGPEKLNGTSHTVTAANVGRLFFPQSKSLGIDRGEYSAAMLDKIVYAGSNNTSFEQGSQDLLKLAEVEVSAKQVERVCKRIGQERVAERRQRSMGTRTCRWSSGRTPAGVTAPEIAVVGCDGGRLQILDRIGAKVEAEAGGDAEDGTPGKHWREDKIACCRRCRAR